MNIVSNQLKAIKTFFSYFALKGLTEKLLFGTGFTVYALFSLFYYPIFSSYEILGYDFYLLDWLRDTNEVVATLRHPLIIFLYQPLLAVVKFLTLFVNIDSALYAVYLFYAAVVAYSFLMVYRILFELVQVSRLRAILLTVLFHSFAHIMIQGFLVDSFPLAMLLLTVSLYIMGREVYFNEKASTYLYNLLFLASAGITITNGLKILIGYLFTDRKCWLKVKRMVVMGGFLMVLSVPIWVALKYRSGILGTPATTAAAAVDTAATSAATALPATDSASLPSKKNSFLSFVNFDVRYWPSIKGNILGESTVFHTIDFGTCVQEGRDIYIDYKNPNYNYIILCFYCFVAIAFFASLKYRFVHIMLGFFSVDVFITLICRFGMDEPYIYAAHWMFIIPICIGYLYKAKALKKVHYVFDAIVVASAAFFLYANWTMILDYVHSVH